MVTGSDEMHANLSPTDDSVTSVLTRVSDTLRFGLRVLGFRVQGTGFGVYVLGFTV